MKGHKHHKNNNKVGNVKEAKRRLGDILTNVQKMALSADDLSRLKAVRKLTQRTVRYPRRLLPLLAGLVTVLMVLIMYSVEEQGLDFRKNISESSVTTCNDGTPAKPLAALPLGQLNQDNAEQSHQNNSVTLLPTKRLVTSTGQLLRREP